MRNLSYFALFSATRITEIMAVEGSGTVQLLRDGYGDAEVQVSQVTPLAVAAMFEVDITTVWLKDEFGPKAFFPDTSHSTFQFTNDVGRSITSFFVRGTPAPRQPSPPAMRMSQSVVTPSTSTARMPSYKPIFSSGKKGACISVKVVQSSISKLSSGKLDFQKLGQTFVDVNETTFNVDYISNCVQRKWGRDYTLVTSDGLRIEDSTGTQGLKFWKVGSWKIYAVLESQLERVVKGKGRKQAHICVSDSDSDDQAPVSKKIKLLGELSLNIQGIRKDLSTIFTLTKGMKLPPGLHTLLYNTFKCNICHSSPMTPPIIFTQCCKCILGCERCVDLWYSGEDGRTKSCPLCRSERAFTETIRIHGLDDFLNGILPLIADEGVPSTTVGASGPSISNTSNNPSRIFSVPTPTADDSDDDFELPLANV